MSFRQLVRRGVAFRRQNITTQVPLLTRRRTYATARPTTVEEESTIDEAELVDPQLPDISRQYLPAKGWQDNLMRRNFGDPVRINGDFIHRFAEALLAT